MLNYLKNGTSLMKSISFSLFYFSNLLIHFSKSSACSTPKLEIVSAVTLASLSPFLLIKANSPKAAPYFNVATLWNNVSVLERLIIFFSYFSFLMNYSSLLIPKLIIATLISALAIIIFIYLSLFLLIFISYSNSTWSLELNYKSQVSA